MTFDHLHTSIVALECDRNRMALNNNGFLAKADKVNVDGLKIGRIF
ncbi:MAG TPA: hypothetical protein VFI68_06500 [Anaerolineales bacterium]|nr:hypothetical protein [Anaerolineales bacterium]